MQIHGFTTGLGPAETKALERIYRRRVPFDRIATQELARSLCEFSHLTGRQVGALIGRSGAVEYVVVGDATKIMLPDIGRLRAAQGRFRGLRLVHTHLRNEPLTRDDLVDLTRLRLDLVAAILVTPEGDAGHVHWAHCVPVRPGTRDEPFRMHGPTPWLRLEASPAAILPGLEEEFAAHARTHATRAKDGRAILVHVCDKRHARDADASLAELRELARTAGLEVIETVLQVRDAIDPKTVLGKGKLDDVVTRAMQDDAQVLVFDRELGPAQAAALSTVTDLKVLDRTQLILDVFAQHAESRDGKLQVELAQMKYLLPRLGLKDDALSRLTGGIGGRGPGETKLEIGKRRARDRVTQLERQLRALGRQREQRRSRRARGEVPGVAIVGYTNAGKSTLLTALTGAPVLAADRLFATLDTRSRRMWLGDADVVVTDTVGFIRALPKDLFAAFRSTFEEARDADLLLHVVDASDDAIDTHVETTEDVLVELGLERLPRLVVYNKADRLTDGHREALRRDVDAVVISATDATTLGPLREAMRARLETVRPIDR